MGGTFGDGQLGQRFVPGRRRLIDAGQRFIAAGAEVAVMAINYYGGWKNLFSSIFLFFVSVKYDFFFLSSVQQFFLFTVMSVQRSIRKLSFS